MGNTCTFHAKHRYLSRKSLKDGLAEINYFARANLLKRLLIRLFLIRT